MSTDTAKATDEATVRRILEDIMRVPRTARAPSETLARQCVEPLGRLPGFGNDRPLARQTETLMQPAKRTPLLLDVDKRGRDLLRSRKPRRCTGWIGHAAEG